MESLIGISHKEQEKQEVESLIGISHKEQEKQEVEEGACVLL